MTARPEKRIKSADRVLEIFEMFSQSRPCVTVMDVVRTLSVPQSSASELLGALVRRGYLQRDRMARTFRPTARVALLGAWVQPSLFRDGRLLPMMDALHDETGATVVLASMVGVGVSHLHMVGDAVPQELGAGSKHHMLHSPFGLAMIASMYSGHVRKLVHRLNAESPLEQVVRLAEIEERLTGIAKQGYCYGGVGDGLAGIALPLPERMDEERLVIGVIGPQDDMARRCADIVLGLRGAIAHYLAPRQRPDTRQSHRPSIAAVN